MFSKNTFLTIIQHHTSGAGGEIVAIFYTFSDTEVVTPMLGVSLETGDFIDLLCCQVKHV